MHQSAKEQLMDHISSFEGTVPWMYLDKKGLVSIAKGKLIDPINIIIDPSTKPKSLRKNFNFYWDGDKNRLATSEEVETEWFYVKSKPIPDWQNAQSFKSKTKLRLTPKDMSKIFDDDRNSKEEWLRKKFGSMYETFPADVQVVLVQMTYGGCDLERWEKLKPLLANREWLKARHLTYLSQGGNKASYASYNFAFCVMMTNAWIVERCRNQPLNYQTLLFVRDLTTFYGIKNALQVVRNGNYIYLGDFDIEPNDIITSTNLTSQIKKISITKRPPSAYWICP